MRMYAYVFHMQCEDQLPLLAPAPATEIDQKIAANVAKLIPDGACLQAGIGGLPDTLLRMLRNHKNLGVHTEMLTNGTMTSSCAISRHRGDEPGQLRSC